MCYFNVTRFGVVFVASPRPADDGTVPAAVVTGLASPRRNMTLLRAMTAEKSRTGNSLYMTMTTTSLIITYTNCPHHLPVKMEC